MTLVSKNVHIKKLDDIDNPLNTGSKQGSDKIIFPNFSIIFVTNTGPMFLAFSVLEVICRSPVTIW